MGMTHFPNGVTSFGIPVFGGGDLGFLLSGAERPSADVQGRIYYVHDGVGSDTANDGLSPDKPYATISKARTIAAARINWSASGVPWANNDMIVVYPGVYNETNLTGGIHGNHLVGLGNSFDVNGETGVVIKPASGSVWDATSFINGSISNIAFFSAAADDCLELDNWNRFLIQDCVFQGVPGASNTTLTGFKVTNDATGSEMKRCWFNQLVDGIYVDVVAPKQFTGCRFEDIYLMAITGTNGAIYSAAGNTSTATIFNRFYIGPTPTYGINDADGIIMFCNGHIEATSVNPATGSGHYSGVYHNGTLLT